MSIRLPLRLRRDMVLRALEARFGQHEKKDDCFRLMHC